MKLSCQIFIRSIIILIVLFLGTVEVFSAACISGFVTDNAGNPVANGDIDIFNAATGAKLVTPNDNTTIDGYYSICVLPGLYHVAYAPPDSSKLLGRKLFNIDLSNNQPQAINLTLDSGLSISGRITDMDGLPVFDVDIDVDSIGGARVYTPNDNSAIITGAYWIVVPQGLFRVRYDSPVGSRLMGTELDSVSVLNDTIIDITLQDGWLLSGQVTNQFGTGLEQIEIGLRDAVTGEKLFISNKDTDSAGLYQVAVPSGLFQLRFAGGPGNNYLGVKNDSVSISSDLVWNQTMNQGIVLTVLVEDEIGLPIQGADIDLKLITTGEKLFTPNDRTDISGHAYAAILPDSYQLEVDPPLGSSYDRFTVPSIVIQNDTMVTVVLQSIIRFAVSGRIIDETNFGVSGVRLDLFSTITGKKAYLVNNYSDSNGYYNFDSPQGSFDMTIAPESGSGLVGLRYSGLQFEADIIVPDIQLQSGIQISIVVLDDSESPLLGVDIDLINRANGVETFTPNDNTNQAGLALLTIEPGEYSIVIDPPVESNYQKLLINKIIFEADTLVTYLLGENIRGGGQANFTIGQNYPNPFNTLTNIPVTMIYGSHLKVEIYNILGQKVTTVLNDYRAAGVYNIIWYGNNSSGKQVASGLYLYRLQTPLGSATRKMVLIK